MNKRITSLLLSFVMILRCLQLRHRYQQSLRRRHLPSRSKLTRQQQAPEILSRLPFIYSKQVR